MLSIRAYTGVQPAKEDFHVILFDYYILVFRLVNTMNDAMPPYHEKKPYLKGTGASSDSQLHFIRGREQGTNTTSDLFTCTSLVVQDDIAYAF